MRNGDSNVWLAFCDRKGELGMINGNNLVVPITWLSIMCSQFGFDCGVYAIDCTRWFREIGLGV